MSTDMSGAPETAPAPTATPTEARTSGVATASLVLGICSIVIGLFFVLGWVLGLLAAILGGVALRQPIANASTARTGRILGVIGFVLTLVVSTIRFVNTRAQSCRHCSS